jgi:hypothetical protein
MSPNRPRRRKQEEETPQTPQKGRLNNMEMLGIGLFSLAFLLYAFSKCGAEEPIRETTTVTEQLVDSIAIAANNGVVSLDNTNNQSTPPRKVDTTSFKNKLYITTDSLRIRKDPQIGGELVGYLKYGEEVIDMGQRTALEKIRVSVDEIRTAPWVKLKTKDGKEGWAFGAYMQFYPVAIETNMPEESNETTTASNEESSHQN